MRVLLIDFATHKTFGGMLATILKGSSPLCVTLRHEVFSTWVNSEGIPKIRGLVDCEKPGIIFMILNAGLSLAEHDSLISICENASGINVTIILVDTHSLDAMVLNYSSGAVTFIIGPPSPNDILPIVWDTISNSA
jgi:hypothetical protein